MLLVREAPRVLIVEVPRTCRKDGGGWDEWWEEAGEEVEGVQNLDKRVMLSCKRERTSVFFGGNGVDASG